jgi:hypothetical protein
MPTCRIKSSSSYTFKIFHLHVLQTETFQAKLKMALALPGKDGLEKSKEECIHTFSKTLKEDCGIARNTFLRNTRIVAV